MLNRQFANTIYKDQAYLICKILIIAIDLHCSYKQTTFVCRW